MKKHKIIVTVDGGLVVDVNFPKKLKDVAVEVRDYDLGKHARVGDPAMEKDADGRQYSVAEWGKQ